jgi:hypothetical protein
MRKTKEKNIQRFIKEENPTSKEMRLFCKLTLAGKYDKELVKSVKHLCSFLTYKELGIQGYYGTNIARWYYLENIENVDGKIKLTDEFLIDGVSLYSQSTHVKVRFLEGQVKRMKTRSSRLLQENFSMSKKIRNMQSTMRTSMGIINDNAEYIMEELSDMSPSKFR